MLQLKFGKVEAAILGRCFYDERLKVRRTEVPVFTIYSALCEGLSRTFWLLKMSDADIALMNLEAINYIRQTQAPDALLKQYIGPSGKSYELTADGLERLQSWHPSIALQVRGWIKVLPPWLVLVSSVTGAIGVIWKASELLIGLAVKLHWLS